MMIFAWAHKCEIAECEREREQSAIILNITGSIYSGEIGRAD